MHSSRMHTARSLTTSRSIRWEGGVPRGMCVLGGGMHAWGACVPGGVHARGGVPWGVHAMHALPVNR